MMISPSVLFGQTCTSNSTRLTGQPLGGDAGCSISCTNGLMYNLGPYQTPTPCLSPLGDGMRLHAGISPIGFEPMPTIRFSYHVEGIVGDCAYERAGRIGIMPPFIINGLPEARLYPVSLNGNFGQNFDVGDVFLVSTCDAKDLLLSTNNAGSRIKFFTTEVAGTQNERMTILDNGNVGINTPAPGYNLQVVNHIAVGAGTGSSTYDPTLAGKMTLFPGNSGWWYHIDNRAENGLTFSGGPTLGDYDIMSMYGNGAQVFIGAQYGSTTTFNPAVDGKLTVSEDATTTGTGYHAYASDILFRVERRNEPEMSTTTVKLISAGSMMLNPLL
ncbi:MAG: hypothetical protein JST20_10810 [Bacteroidetes bacterium]|nr:hypothetical protein [Bacteroidota bacterium]